MTDEEFRALLDLWMCSDPWPVMMRHSDEIDMNNQQIIEEFLNKESKLRNYDDIIEAFHDFKLK